jgi:16S rRNA A1518/A1519 N6-dimethyltransferase RsmA/KsgA/DIM1 with predicted DNA glycosylase/AP lyase activity
LVRLAFQQRRKTLRNAVKSQGWNLGNSTIDLGRRGETLTLVEFAQLAQEINRQQ